jgi:hypothetical protein
VTKLRLRNQESTASDQVTASVAAVTGTNVDPAHLLTAALSKVQDLAATGGNRVFAMTV